METKKSFLNKFTVERKWRKKAVFNIHNYKEEKNQFLSKVTVDFYSFFYSLINTNEEINFWIKLQ